MQSLTIEIPVLVFRHGIAARSISTADVLLKIQATKFNGLEDDEYRNNFSNVVQFCGYYRTMENTK